MATPEPKAEGEDRSKVNHFESREKLTSVTNHEKFSVSEGHEVTVVQHTTNNAEAVVSVSSEDINVAPPGKLVALAWGNVEEVNPPRDGGAQVETAGDAVFVTTTAEVPDAAPASKEVETRVSETMDPAVTKVFQDAEEKKEVAAEAAHYPNCLVDSTNTLITAEEPEVMVKTATQDKAIVPGEEPVSPAVNRPKRPPPPSQETPQIVPSTSGSIRSQPPANRTASTGDHNLKAKSLKRFREFGSSMRKTFNQVKTKLKPKPRDGKDDIARSTTGVDGSGKNSLYSSTDLYTSHPSSVTNTPQITRKDDRMAMAMPDLQIAMGNDPGSPSQAEVLSWTAKSIAVDASQRRGAEEPAVPFENAVQPMHVARGTSPQRGLLAQMTPETMGSSPVSPPRGDSRKPPVSPTRPATEYNRNRSDREPSTRRPATFWGGLSLDRRRNDQVQRHVPLEIRRTQTLRTTDYPARLHDRLQRYQTESHHEDSTQPAVYKRKTCRTEVSERSDKVSWPFKSLSFRRNHPPKKVYAAGQDPNSSRVKLRPNTSSHYNVDIVRKMEGPVHVAPPIIAQKENPQRITPPCLSREVSNSNPVLTSLVSHKRMAMLQQMSKGIHVEARPVSHLVMYSDEPVGQAAPLPYFSNILMKTVNWTQGDASQALRSGVEEVHPFLATWTVELASVDEVNGEAGEEPRKEVDVTCLQYYLTNCLKLYSADLQGEFAPLHYPLNDSNVRHWPQCVILDDCGEVRVLREPHLDTEYLELVNLVEQNVGQRTLFYANQPIDRLLTAWLDCRSTVRATAGTPRRETPAYHPVQVVVKLSQVLALDGEHNGLLDACLRLAVLLTYNYVKTQCHSLNHDDVCLDTEAHRITLFMTTTNCLVAFTRKAEEEAPKKVQSDEPKTPEAPGAVSVEATATEDKSEVPTSTEQSGEKTETAEAPASPVAGTSAASQHEQPAEPTIGFELGTLLKSTKCDKCTTSEEAIDSVIFEIRRLATSPPTARSLAVSMMRAVVPPDWMAMTLARVCIAKE